MLSRKLAVIFALSALVFGLVALHLYLSATVLELQFDSAYKKLFEVNTEGPQQVVFYVRNTSSRDHRLLGSVDSCGPTGCAKVLLEAPVLIPPGTQAEVPILCTPHVAADFDESVRIFTSAPGQIEITLRVIGPAVRR